MAAETILIKFGTESLMKDGKLDPTSFSCAAKQINELIQDKYKIIIVSSGAIQAGREQATKLDVDTKKLHKKDFAGMGSPILLRYWAHTFEKFNIAVAEVLITHANWRCDEEKNSIQSSINNYLASGIIPIINENDVVSDREIRLMDEGISENDHLARLVAEITNPNRIIFITKSGGVFDKNPELFPDVKRYLEIDINNIPELLLDSSDKSENGSGGIGKKVVEAAKCCRDNRVVAITGIGFILESEDSIMSGTILSDKNEFAEI
jgi:glutamate 5-kinase